MSYTNPYLAEPGRVSGEGDLVLTNPEAITDIMRMFAESMKIELGPPYPDKDAMEANYRV
jgi:hypothetical protein